MIEERDRLAGEVFEAEHVDDFVGRAVLVVAEPPALARREFAAIDVDVRGSRAVAESRGLQARLGKADGLDRGVFHLLRVIAGQEGRAVIVDGGEDQVFRPDAGLRGDARRHLGPDGIGDED